ncbi:protein PXR1 [Drosophila busckii]|uniref:protein PXR1 n=1 Tax=Drosophila busckii TaxID=30019 RepID=UPI001432A13F|nr:protein PXR1 [Drosophila busckii]
MSDCDENGKSKTSPQGCPKPKSCRPPPAQPTCLPQPTLWSKLNCVPCNRLFFFFLGAGLALWYDQHQQEAKKAEKEKAKQNQKSPKELEKERKEKEKQQKEKEKQQKEKEKQQKEREAKEKKEAEKKAKEEEKKAKAQK